MEKKKINLKESGVVFDDAAHTYHLGDKQLSGITGVINKHIFPDKYSGVPKSVLDKRASFGSDFHSDMEIYINIGVESSTDIFRVFKENYSDIRFAASEYIVTDGTDFASPIDAIDEDTVIYDFKTSTKPDLEYWKWQLTVYRYLFYLQNGYEPAGYRVLWINKDLKHNLYQIEPYPMEAAEKLLDAERNGGQFDYSQYMQVSIVETEVDLKKLGDIELGIANLKLQMDKLQQQEKEIKSALLEVFKKHGVKKWESDILTVTIKSAYTQSKLNTAGLKEKHPKIYKKFLYDVQVDESVVITVKKQGKKKESKNQ